MRVHFFDPTARAVAPPPGVLNRPELCVAPGWDLPKGLAGRWQPGALCSILVPPECQAWPALGIWVSPLERQKLHDWVAERGAPGLLCHLWLTHGG
jgi:hypothetical protein